MIDRATVDRIFDAAKIEEVVSDYVSLRKRGVNYIGLCPFHNEKTPSFTVSPAKGICKCFGCGKGGNPVNFLMELEQLSYVEALKTLAKKYHIEIEEKEESPEQLQERNDRESMLVVNEFAAKYFTNQLLNTEEGTNIGLSYFKERGFQESIIDKFHLGYSPEQKDAFTKRAITKGYKTTYLVKTGLTIQGDNYQADRFRGRVMFPIHNLTGKVVGFGGRILRTDKKTAKYLNSPESEIYHKGNILYGIFHAKKEMVQQDRCYLVEGYTDVMALHQAGIENVVASSGTALTPGQIRLIKRFTNNITVIYDGDAAGIKASLRGIDLILEQGLNVRILLLPEGEDPDSFSKKQNATAFQQYIEDNNSDFIKFKTRLLLDESKNDPIKRAQLVTDIVKSIAIIPDAIIRQVYARECSTMMKMDEKVILGEISKMKKQQKEEAWKQENRARNMQRQQPSTLPTPNNNVQKPVAPPSPFEHEERMIVKFLVKYGEHTIFNETDPEYEEHKELKVSEVIFNGLEEDELILKNDTYALILREYEEHISETFEPEKYFTRHHDHNLTRIISDIIAEPYEISKMHTEQSSFTGEEKHLKNIIPKILLEYKSKILDQRLAELKSKMQNSTDAAQLMEIMKQIQEYTTIRKQIRQALGGRIF